MPELRGPIHREPRRHFRPCRICLQDVEPPQGPDDTEDACGVTGVACGECHIPFAHGEAICHNRGTGGWVHLDCVLAWLRTHAYIPKPVPPKPRMVDQLFPRMREDVVEADLRGRWTPGR